MSSIINSTTTSPGGLISTGDSANSLLIQTGDTTAITINSSQQVALTNPLGAASGGTGLSSPGTSGNVLTSNGTGWTSTALPASGFNGSTETTSATTVTLTNASTQVQAINMTAASQNVVLPNATTLTTEGGPIFVVTNTGFNSFNLVDTAGYTINAVAPFETVALYLISNATSAGTWTTNTELAKFKTLTVSLSSASSTLNQTGPTMLSESVGVYANSSYELVPFTLAGGVVTNGTPVASGASSSAVQGIIRLSSTTGVVLYPGSPYGSAMYAKAFTVSGNVLTLGSAVTVSTASPPSTYREYIFGRRMSDTSIMIFSPGYNTAGVMKMYTVSGTTLTETSSASISTNNSGYYTSVDIGNNTVVWASSGYAQYAVVTYSGTSITGSSSGTLDTSGYGSSNQFCMVSSLNTGSFIYFVSTSSSYSTEVVGYATVSGTTVTTVAATVSSSQFGSWSSSYRTLGFLAPNVFTYQPDTTSPIGLYTITQSSGTSEPVITYGGNIGFTTGTTYVKQQLTDWLTSGIPLGLSTTLLMKAS